MGTATMAKVMSIPTAKTWLQKNQSTSESMSIEAKTVALESTRISG